MPPFLPCSHSTQVEKVQKKWAIVCVTRRDELLYNIIRNDKSMALLTLHSFTPNARDEEHQSTTIVPQFHDKQLFIYVW